ncbi:hypothetical protein ACQ4PT_047581 [Festuca glaucescens]
MARLATILSFGDHAADVPETEQHAPEEEYRKEQEHDDTEDDDDAASDASDDSFEFAFARPLAPEGQHSADALADDLFAHGRIIPAYPVFHRNHDDASVASASSATAPPSPDTYCAWTPRSAPGSPAAFPKSASTGQAVPRFRIRDLIGSGAGRRSHSNGKEKFLFIQPSTPKPNAKTTTTTTPPASAAASPLPAAKKPSSSSQPKTKQSKKKGAAPVTEMDMATAHRLFYSKPAATSATGTERPSTATKKSYLPYRPAIVGFFAAAHGLRPKHHPY